LRIPGLHTRRHAVKLERLQRIATKITRILENITYYERLKQLDLSELEERRWRGTYKCLHKQGY